MHISAQNDFAAAPDQVMAMLLDPEFLNRCCAATDPIRYDVVVTGTTSRTTRVYPVPPVAAKIVKTDLILSEQVTWQGPTADETYLGTMTGSAEGLPVTVNATITLQPGGRGSIASYDGELKVNIPFLGSKLEKEAAPALLSAVEVQQSQGDTWLAK